MNKYEAIKGDELILKYKVRLPQAELSHPPLLILLHGVGSNEDDLFKFADHLPAGLIVVSARAPYTLDQNRYAWYQVDFSSGKPVINAEQAEKSLAVLKLFINQLAERYQADPARVYLAGFSQGAIMSYSAAFTYPEKLAGIAAFSGRILDEVKPSFQLSPALKNLEIFISHGIHDPMLPVNYAREAKELIEGYQLHLSYHEYENGHTIDAAVYTDFLGWLRTRLGLQD